MLRWDVTSRTAEQLDTFAMALLAAIGELPDTIMDRAVIIRMRRRAPGEHVAALPHPPRRPTPPRSRATASPPGPAPTCGTPARQPRRCRWRTGPPTPGNR